MRTGSSSTGWIPCARRQARISGTCTATEASPLRPISSVRMPASRCVQAYFFYLTQTNVNAGARLAKARHHLLTQEPERVQHPLMRNEAAAIEFGQDAVEADLLLQPAQLVGGARRRAYQHVV